MSDNKKRIPKWLSSRLFALYAIPMCVVGFVLYFVTGLLQAMSTFMIFIIESIEWRCIRWRYFDCSYLKKSFDFIIGIGYGVKMLIMGSRDD